MLPRIGTSRHAIKDASSHIQESCAFQNSENHNNPSWELCIDAHCAQLANRQERFARMVDQTSIAD
jgi:hypothetical protein